MGFAVPGIFEQAIPVLKIALKEPAGKKFYSLNSNENAGLLSTVRDMLST